MNGGGWLVVSRPRRRRAISISYPVVVGASERLAVCVWMEMDRGERADGRVVGGNFPRRVGWDFCVGGDLCIFGSQPTRRQRLNSGTKLEKKSCGGSPL